MRGVITHSRQRWKSGAFGTSTRTHARGFCRHQSQEGVFGRRKRAGTDQSRISGWNQFKIVQGQLRIALDEIP